jgi:hypothetical protein
VTLILLGWWQLAFFQMGELVFIPTDLPLGCILCNVAWSIHRLPDQEVWPQDGTLTWSFLLKFL